jgi:nickel/cobalt transporter (NiCoT) family protein
LERKALALYVLLTAANLLAWGWAFLAFRGHAGLMGTALLAYGFGLRHAIDADHIAAIDNVTRKLMQVGKRPIGVGLYFALGHSSIVIVIATVIAASATTLQDRYPSLVQAGGTVGTLASSMFLLAIGAANAFVLVGVYRLFRQVRRGGVYRDDELDSYLVRRGLLGWVLRRVFRLVSRSWHMYPLGLLFGLGFDTASEIGLLGIAASEAAKGLPIWSILVFPALFTAGMALIDTTDGVLMLGAYGWAFRNPVRKLYYNMTITGVSVVVAVLIGGVEALSLIADKLGLSGGLWDIANDAAANFGLLGYVIVGVFLCSWAGSMLFYRLRGYDKLRA